MASEEQVDLSVRLPPALGEWVREHATEQDAEPDELVQQLLSAYQTVSSHAETNGGIDFDTPGGNEALEERIDAQHEEFMDHVEDVRDRVIQVKYEADDKAPADHNHADLSARLDDLDADIDALEDDLGEVEETVERGFENFEDILEYLVDTSDDLDAKLVKLARVTLDVRSEVSRLAAAEARRAEVEALKLAANRSGVERAKCDECETNVTVALLTEPTCPHCASSFSDVEPSSSFGPFGTHRLLTGDPPALPEGAEPSMDEQLAEEFLDEAGDDSTFEAETR
ncbi:hypothetical protein [Haloarchaeobius sp. DFWS5]|uniref:hypothetical protein n=1 Tax=Haloarchaeobius sp. DFWS5 TaxID=3446114 RepID=UPI003EBF08AF